MHLNPNMLSTTPSIRAHIPARSRHMGRKSGMLLRDRNSRMAVQKPLFALDPDNATVLVAGGSGVGLETVKLLKDMGSWAYMLPSADVERRSLEDLNVVVVKGDLTDDAKIKAMMQDIDGLEAVVSTADAPKSIRLIRAALETDVQRFVLLVNTQASSVDIQPAEQELMSHEDRLEFVIVRASELVTEPATDCAVFSEEPVTGVLHREDVAQLLIKALFSERPKNKAYSIVHKYRK